MKGSVLARIDNAFEITMERHKDLNGLTTGYIKAFLKSFRENHETIIPQVFTRYKDARDSINDIDSNKIMAEIMKYGIRAKTLAMESRIDQVLMEKYPFLLPMNGEYMSSMLGVENLIEFFLTERYKEYGKYSKYRTDTPELFALCQRDADMIDDMFDQDFHTRKK